MKTKLLLLLFGLFALQINAQSTAPGVGVNTITAITATTATVNYAVRTNGSYTSCKINFSLASNMNPAVGQTPNVGFNQAGPWQNASVNLSGLTPNKTYYVQAQASNSLGTVNSNILSFTTPAAPVISPVITEYTFNNTLNNVNGNSPFVSNNFTYVDDRKGIAQSALRINGSGTYATIPNLPVGTSPRSVSIWYKVASLNSSDNCLFVYGNSGGENSYGVLFNGYDSWSHFSWLTSTPFANPSNDGLWHHLVTTFDSTKTTRVYIDGVLKTTVVQNGWNTSAGANSFWLGGLFQYNTNAYNGTVDDLKIYNIALTQTQINNLFDSNDITLNTTNNTVTSSGISLYPNPVKDILNIKSNTDIQSVIILNTVGQKVLQSKGNQINTSKLSTGVYMIQIKDSKNQMTNMKFIKN